MTELSQPQTQVQNKCRICKRPDTVVLDEEYVCCECEDIRSKTSLKFNYPYDTYCEKCGRLVKAGRDVHHPLSSDVNVFKKVDCVFCQETCFICNKMLKKYSKGIRVCGACFKSALVNKHKYYE